MPFARMSTRCTSVSIWVTLPPRIRRGDVLGGALGCGGRAASIGISRLRLMPGGLLYAASAPQ